MKAKTTDRYSSDFLNERENFFHKPLVNLNHFYDINDDIRLSSAYWSGGSGGGTEPMVVIRKQLLSKEILVYKFTLDLGLDGETS